MSRHKGLAGIGFSAVLFAAALFTVNQVQAQESPAAPTTGHESSVAPAPVASTPAHEALAAAGLVDETTQHVRVDAVRDLLDELEPAGSAPAHKYDRDTFGQRWADIDRNGCDTRNDLLSRDLRDVQYKPGTRDCVVIAGTLDDPYTGETIEFVRGQGTSELVPIDHVIPLAWAYDHGAATWAPETREQFANDPLNLQATTRGTNSSKLDRGPADWLPPAPSYKCTYIARFVLIASTYELMMPATDAAAATAVLDQCATVIPDNEPEEAPL